jgi:hypothetical protein
MPQLQRLASRAGVAPPCYAVLARAAGFVSTGASVLGMPLALANPTQRVYQMARAAGLNKQDGAAIKGD